MNAAGREQPDERTREYGRHAALLTVAVGISGVLVYVYFSISSHTLSADDYGELAVLWSIVYVVGGVLFRPAEQLLARSLAERGSRAARVGPVLRLAVPIQLGLTALAIGLAFAARGPIERDMIGTDPAMFAILIAALLTCSVNFLARGALAGTQRFGAYAWLLIIESVSRAAFAVLVVIGIGSGQIVASLGIAAAPLLALLAIPLGRAGDRGGSPQDGAVAAAADPAVDRRAGGAFAAAVLAIMFSEQIILTAGALIVRATEGAAAAGFIFNIFIVARAPLLLFQATATSLLPHLTQLNATATAEARAAFARSVRLTIAGSLAAATALGAVLVVAGPALMQLAFGDKFEYDRLGLLLVAVGLGLYLSGTTLSQAALARNAARPAAAAWLASAVCFLLVNVPSGFDRFRQVEVAFAVSGLLLCALLAVVYFRHRSRHGGLVPGSADELEARLAAAEGAG